MRLHKLTTCALNSLLLLALGLSLSACSKGCRTADTASQPVLWGDGAHLKQGGQLFGFDYNLVTELLLIKADPVSGDRWAARLYRDSAQGGADAWRIERAGGEESALLENRADGFFILHLLDTLRTLRAERIDVPGTPESLGLTSPRFALKWKVSEREFEVRIGAPEAKAGAEHAGAIRAYAQVPGQNPIVADGATLQMLEYISGFTQLRLKTWPGIVSDDIDEIELSGSGGPFYAQREGADWTDRKHRSIRGDVAQWLERLTHERVLSFVDDRARNDTLSALLKKSPALQATLKDRHGTPVRLAIAQIEGRWYGTSTARPGAVLEIYPGSRQAMTPPHK